MIRPPVRFILPLIALVLVIVGFGIFLLRRRATQDIFPMTSTTTTSSDKSVPVPSDEVSDHSSASNTERILIYTAPPKKAAPARLAPSSRAVQLSVSSTVSGISPTQNTAGIQLLQLNVDSDGDGVSDRDEKEMYRTDPAKADTDGDSYPDGEEIEKGYNPLGPGKCAQPSCIPSV